MKDITSTITKPLAILGENGKGYTKEANFNAAKRAGEQMADYFEKGDTRFVVNK